MVLYLGVSHGGYFGQNIYMYMGGLYNYCIVICFAVLTTFHSVPIFPRHESWAFNGDYSDVQGLSFRTCARNLPFAGFAILSAFEMVAERGCPQALPYFGTPLTV